MSPEIAAWLAYAVADADRRALPGLKPLLETLAQSTQALRDADQQFNHPALGPGALGNDGSRAPR
jgi:hypothetical protein